MIYLYGIAETLAALPEGSGLEGAPLQGLPVGSLTALYTTHSRLDLRADAESCWAHQQALETVMALQAVLPARFGTTFPDLDELSSAVIRDAGPLQERLAEIDGCVELAVRINPLRPREGQTSSGRRYLMDRLSAQRQREALAESTLACLRELAVDSRLAPSQPREESVGISYLVLAGGVERFSRAVGRLHRRWPEFGLTCTGPWPPYSFAAGPSSAVAEEAV